MVDSPWPHYRTGVLSAQGVQSEAGLHRPPTLHDDPGPESQRHSERRRIQRRRLQRRGWVPCRRSRPVRGRNREGRVVNENAPAQLSCAGRTFARPGVRSVSSDGTAACGQETARPTLFSVVANFSWSPEKGGPRLLVFLHGGLGSQGKQSAKGRRYRWRMEVGPGASRAGRWYRAKQSGIIPLLWNTITIRR